MEYEVRYYYPKEKLESIIEKLKSIKGLKMGSRCYEKTEQFDHPNSEMSFYSKEIDGFNQEVKSYDISKSPNLEQINRMLNIAFEENTNLKDLIFHSDQGWQYQHQSYQQQLKNKGIRQSMSRKENSMDNGLMENFFGILKTEMFYNQEDNYKTIDDLINAIKDYIYYYNHDRIKKKLKGLSPVNYRLQSSN